VNIPLAHLNGMFVNQVHLMPLKPAVFMHIQKTAGTSIVDLARRHYGRANISSHGDFMTQPDDEQISKPFVSGHFGYDYGRRLMKDRYSFTFLRNPAERILSFYYFCKNQNPDEYPEFKLVHENSLDRYLELVNESKNLNSWNLITRMLAHSWKSVPDFTEDELVDLAIRHLDEFSYVGFTETFDSDMEVIVRRLGIIGVRRYYKSNVSKDRVIIDELPSCTRKLLDRASELDRHVYELAWARRRS